MKSIDQCWKMVFFSHDAELYGASRSLITLVKGLTALGIECLIIVPYKGPLIPYIVENNLNYFVAYYPSWFYKSKDLQGTHMFKLISRFLFHQIKVSFDSELNDIIKKYDLVVSNTSAIPIGAFISIRHKKTHIWHIRELVELDYGFKYILGKRFFLYLIGKTKLRLFNSKFVMNYYKDLLPEQGINQVIYNGIYSIKEFVDCRDRYNGHRMNDDPTFVFCLIGYIHSGKGQEQAVDAMAEIVSEFRNVRLVVAGNGNVEALQKYIDDRRVGAFISLTGFVKDVGDVLVQADCLLNCAKYEAFGRTTVEAMAHGLPVIGNNTAGTAEIVQQSVTGLLYNGTTEQLVLAMKRLITDKVYARQLGLNAWKVASEKYTVERYVRDFYSFVETNVVLR